MHPAVWIALGHLLMDDATPRRHPLDVTGSDGPAVPEAVTVLDGPRKDVRDGLDAPVGVPWETRQVILRPLIPEVVEQQERVEVGRLAEAEGATQVHARTLNRRLRLD